MLGFIFKEGCVKLDFGGWEVREDLDGAGKREKHDMIYCMKFFVIKIFKAKTIVHLLSIIFVIFGNNRGLNIVSGF